jgi:hypothetical protein
MVAAGKAGTRVDGVAPKMAQSSVGGGWQAMSIGRRQLSRRCLGIASATRTAGAGEVHGERLERKGHLSCEPRHEREGVDRWGRTVQVHGLMVWLVKD